MLVLVLGYALTRQDRLKQNQNKHSFFELKIFLK